MNPGKQISQMGEEAAQIFSIIVGVLDDLEEKFAKKISDHKDDVSKQIEDGVSNFKRLRDEFTSLLSESKTHTDKNLSQAVFDTLTEARKEIEQVKALIPDTPDLKTIWTSLAELEKKIPQLPDLSPVWNAIKEVENKIPIIPELQKIPDIPLPLTPIEIRDSLESLQGDERTPIEAIKNLREELDALKKQNTYRGGGVIGRNLVKDIDISAQLDGGTKTFNIEAVWNIISVSLSSFPTVLRKNIDFTYTPTSITFTNQIDAGSSLASGQTCVLTVVTG